ncbi:MAG TPA: hypothetical protein VHB73_07050, partial [Alphaproteobacteria bacterium]|nr:hypothetical protein [Alphaproteobacteria bacterium]
PPCSSTDITNGTRKKGICQTGLSAANRLQVKVQGGTQQAALVILSHGANGRGAFAEVGGGGKHTAFPASVPACVVGTSGPERCNADDDINFVAAIPGESTDPFDDTLLYFDRNALVASLGGPGCQSTW